MVFCFVQNFFSDNARVRIFFFCRANFFSPEFNIRLYDKNSESDYFFSSTKIRLFFSATLGIRIFFQKKNITPPGPSLIHMALYNFIAENVWNSVYQPRIPRTKEIFLVKNQFGYKNINSNSTKVKQRNNHGHGALVYSVHVYVNQPRIPKI